MDRTTHVLDVKPIHIPIVRNRIREETVAAGDKRKRTTAHDGLFFHNHTSPAIQIIARNRFNGNEKNVRFGEDIYLTSVSDEGCVFQIVREPWRYFALVGILMLIAGAFMLFVGGPRR